MAFTLPEGLAPEMYPLAWLVGRWHGEGVVGYPGIEETAFTQDVVIDHDGGPYLSYTSTIRLVVVPDRLHLQVDAPRLPLQAGEDRHAQRCFVPLEGAMERRAEIKSKLVTDQIRRIHADRPA